MSSTQLPGIHDAINSVVLGNKNFIGSMVAIGLLGSSVGPLGPVVEAGVGSVGGQGKWYACIWLYRLAAGACVGKSRSQGWL